MSAEIREDITYIGTRRHRMAQDLVTDVVEVETRTTAEATVREEDIANESGHEWNKNECRT